LAANQIAQFELIESRGGVFEITINGVLRYSKKAKGRFPTDEELTVLASD